MQFLAIEVPLYPHAFSFVHARSQLGISVAGHAANRGSALEINSPPPWGFHRVLGIELLWHPRGALFLMGEVTL